MQSHIGPYAIRGELARGNMGVVYRAFDPHLNRDVAIKVLSAVGPVGEAEARRFQEEARATARLHHPGIVGLHSAGSAHGQPYLVMDLVEGRSLHERIKREGPLDPLEAAEITRELAEALQYAHDQGVLHRDVKPQNVLLDRDGRPRLADFGVARLIERDERITRTGEVLGTPYYMSPEQAAGRPERIGPGSDVYSLGATLFEMLCGQPPFEGASAIETLTAVVNLPPRRPSELRPDLDAAIKAITLRCLAKEPEDRFASAAELAEELADYLATPPHPAQPGGARWAFALGGLVLGAGVALPLGYLLAPRAAAPTPTPAAPPAAGPSLLELGRSFLLRGELSSAATCLERALQAAPADVHALTDLARVRAQQSREAEAEDLLRRAAELDPESPRVLLARGCLHLKRGDVPAALQVLERATARDPQLADAWNALGSARSRSRDLARGAEAFTRAIELDAEHVTAWLNRARVRARLSRTDGALADVEQALRLAPGLSDAHFVRGKLLALLDRRAEALAAYQQAAHADPTRDDAFAEQAILHANAGRRREALEAFTRAIGLAQDPKRRGKLLSDRGLVHVRARAWEPARHDFDAALRLDPKHTTALLNRGSVRGATGDLDGALADYDRVLELDPKHRQALLARGATLRDRDPDRALRDLRAAVRVDPTHPRAVLTCAKFLNQRRRPREALELLDALIRARGRTAGAEPYIERGKTHALLRDQPAALADLRRALTLLPEGSPARAKIKALVEQLERSR